MSEALFTYRGTVFPWHCDHMGHMNVMWYVGKFDEATWHFLNALGLSSDYLRGVNRGMAAVDQHIAYLRELRAGNIVTIRSTLLEFKIRSLVFSHEMSNDETGEAAARTKLTAVHLDLATRKSCAFDGAIVAKANAMLAKA